MSTVGVSIEFLKRPLKGAERKIFLSVKRGLAHRAKKVSRFVQTPGRKLRLFFLPLYSQVHNPYEWAWKHLRAGTVGHMMVSSTQDFAKKVRHSMRELQNNPQKIISLLSQAVSLSAAAGFPAVNGGGQNAHWNPSFHTGTSGLRGSGGSSMQTESLGRTVPSTRTMPKTPALRIRLPCSSRPSVAAIRPG